jgi:hypothetical protein
MPVRGLMSVGFAGLALLAALPATAAAQQTAVVGSNCAATLDQTFSEGTTLPTEVADDSTSATAPFNGVITQWTVNIAYQVEPFPQRLFVASMTGTGPGGEDWAMLGPGPTETVKVGLNTFSAQIPITSGETIALSSVGAQGSPICVTNNDDDVSATSATGLQPGDQGKFLQAAGLQIPGTATVESDSDKDGYGDLTQDGCPRSKRTHKACPRIHLDAHADARKHAARVIVGSSTRAGVTVKGQAIVPGSGSKTAIRLRPVTRTFNAGHLGRFKLAYPGGLKHRLRELPRNRRVKLRFTAEATDKAGVKTVAKARARVRGRASQ